MIAMLYKKNVKPRNARFFGFIIMEEKHETD